MAFGMNLGIGAAMGQGRRSASFAGVPSSGVYQKHGSSIRTGGKPGAAGLPKAGVTGVEDTEDAMRQASAGARGAASGAQVAARGGGMGAPVARGLPEPEEDPTEGVQPLGGGTMGIKPDFTSRNVVGNELRNMLRDQNSSISQYFQGGPQVLAAKLQRKQMEYELLDRQAREDAAYAAASDPQYEQWKTSREVTPEGQLYEESNQGRRRLAETRTTTGLSDFQPKDTAGGPPSPADDAYRRAIEAGVELPAIEMQRIDPRMDPRIVEQRQRSRDAQGLLKEKEKIDIADETRGNTEWDRRQEIETKGRVEVKKTTPGKAPATPRDPAAAKPRAEPVVDLTKLDRVGAEMAGLDEYAWKELPLEKKNEWRKKARPEIINLERGQTHTKADPWYGAGGTGGRQDGATKEGVVQGRKVLLRWNAGKSKWVVEKEL